MLNGNNDSNVCLCMKLLSHFDWHGVKETLKYIKLNLLLCKRWYLKKDKVLKLKLIFLGIIYENIDHFQLKSFMGFFGWRWII